MQRWTLLVEALDRANAVYDACHRALANAADALAEAGDAVRDAEAALDSLEAARERTTVNKLVRT